MTSQIAAVLAILAVALALFVSDKMRADVVAMLTLSALGVSGLLSPANALAGFSNPAVVTIWSMFILSAGLSATGVADLIGKLMIRMAGRSEPRVILTVMGATGGLSAFMNNIGVAAMMLPVVMDIARRTGLAPPRLLMPMAFASLLGGLTTLVGTSLNLVASDALRQAGHGSFSLFSFTPVGLPALVIGSLFVAFFGRRLLPREMPGAMRASRQAASGEWQFSHDLEERRFRLRVGAGSPFHGQPLRDTGLGAMLGINVLAVQRGGNVMAPVDGDFVLEQGDLLEVQGRQEEYEELLHWQALEVARGSEIAELLSPRKMVLASATVAPGAEIDGLTVSEADFRRRYHAHILTLKREGKVIRSGLPGQRLAAGDTLQLELRKEDYPVIETSPAFSRVEKLTEESFGQIYPETESLLELDIPEDSLLAGRAVAQSGLGDALKLRVVAIGRRPESVFFPDAGEILRPGDKLLVHGSRESLARVRGLQSLELAEDGEIPPLPAARRSREVFTEVTLSPRGSLAGKTLRELDFRRRYGLQVLSIWRQGRAYRSHLRNFKLEFGDALLLSGERERIRALKDDPDFLLLSRAPYEDDEARSPRRALLAAALMIAVAGVVMAGLLPVAIAALAGATLMVVTRCLSIESAHRAIEWKSVFLIACMIPLGTAMKETGAAEWLAGGVVAATRPLGGWGLVAGLYLLTALGSTVIPAAALVLIMAHVGIDAATAAGLAPQAAVMAVAMAAGAGFASPISHPANILVMGPGGYRFADYLRLGLPLGLIVMLTVLPLLFWIW